MLHLHVSCCWVAVVGLAQQLRCIWWREHLDLWRYGFFEVKFGFSVLSMIFSYWKDTKNYHALPGSLGIYTSIELAELVSSHLRDQVILAGRKADQGKAAVKEVKAEASEKLHQMCLFQGQVSCNFVWFSKPKTMVALRQIWIHLQKSVWSHGEVLIFGSFPEVLGEHQGHEVSFRQVREGFFKRHLYGDDFQDSTLVPLVVTLVTLVTLHTRDIFLPTIFYKILESIPKLYGIVNFEAVFFMYLILPAKFRARWTGRNQVRVEWSHKKCFFLVNLRQGLQVAKLSCRKVAFGWYWCATPHCWTFWWWTDCSASTMVCSEGWELVCQILIAWRFFGAKCFD